MNYSDFWAVPGGQFLHNCMPLLLILHSLELYYWIPIWMCRLAFLFKHCLIEQKKLCGDWFVFFFAQFSFPSFFYTNFTFKFTIHFLSIYFRYVRSHSFVRVKQKWLYFERSSCKCTYLVKFDLYIWITEFY